MSELPDTVEALQKVVDDSAKELGLCEYRIKIDTIRKEQLLKVIYDANVKASTLGQNGAVSSSPEVPSEPVPTTQT